MEIPANDLEVDVYRAPLNDRAVRITHFPSGISVRSEDLPTREQNYSAAVQLLREALGE